MAKLKLTPEMLRSVYEFLDTTAPFCKWNLPGAEDVDFRVGTTLQYAGTHQMVGGKHIISVSSVKVTDTIELIVTMAHEMVHLFMREVDIDEFEPHSIGFVKLAKQVCKIHGFDYRTF
jgi:hypothetical protein